MDQSRLQREGDCLKTHEEGFGREEWVEHEGEQDVVPEQTHGEVVPAGEGEEELAAVAP